MAIEWDKDQTKNRDVPILIEDREWLTLFGRSINPRLRLSSLILRKMLQYNDKVYREIVEARNNKRKLMDRILQLSQEIDSGKGQEVFKEMEEAQGSIIYLNKKLDSLERRHHRLREKIRTTNLKLLEYTVQAAYRTIRMQESAAERTAKRIESLKSRLNQAIDEKHRIEEQKTRTYRLIHGFLGGEKTDRLDESLLNGK